MKVVLADQTETSELECAKFEQAAVEAVLGLADTSVAAHKVLESATEAAFLADPSCTDDAFDEHVFESVSVGPSLPAPWHRQKCQKARCGVRLTVGRVRLSLVAHCYRTDLRN